MSKTFAYELAAHVTHRFGGNNLTVRPNAVFADNEDGFFYYIPKGSLQEFHPLLLVHYSAMPGETHPLWIVVSNKDWELLEQDKISVQEYIDNSTWNYGYFWGGGSMLGGSRWMPFEEKGIHDTAKIGRYLTILQCRTARRSSGYLASEAQCSNCTVKNCPFSRFNNINSWDNEVPETDDRIDAFNAVAKMLSDRFGLKTVKCHNTSHENVVEVYPGFDKNSVEVYLPTNLLVDMLYHPGKYDIDELVHSLKLTAGIPWHYDQNQQFVAAQHIDVPESANIEFLLDYWKDHLSQYWFAEEPSSSDVEPSSETVEDPNQVPKSRLVRLIHKIIAVFKG